MKRVTFLLIILLAAVSLILSGCGKQEDRYNTVSGLEDAEPEQEDTAVCVAVGLNHTVILKDDGTVIALGRNDKGQCNVPARLSAVRDVAAGNIHTVALKEDGTVIAWGGNDEGQCDVPPGLNGVIAIAAGSSHTAVLKDDGTVVAWGRKSEGQCSVPAGLSQVRSIAAGYYQTFAIKEDGTAIGWGKNDCGQCNIPAELTDVKLISAGREHTAAIKEDGTVAVWGNNGSRQCNIPVGLDGVKEIATSSVLFYVNEEGEITQAPHTPTYAVKEDGTLTAWGFDINYGPNVMLGSVDVPEGLSGVRTIAAGYHKVALMENGKVLAWGYNKDGQCDIPRALAAQAPEIDDSSDTIKVNAEKDVKSNLVKGIAAGELHTLALREDGTVAAWGNNEYGQCDVPENLTSVRKIAAGDHFSAALKEDGTVVTWGSLHYTGNVYLPFQSPDRKTLSDVTDIAAGSRFIIALKGDKTVTAWGHNGSGQCNIPAGLMQIKAIAAGRAHSAVLKEDGSVIAWGENRHAQCDVPEGLQGIRDIEAGYDYTAAIREDGTVSIWGKRSSQYRNYSSWCNNKLTDICAVSMGGGFMVCLREDGKVISILGHVPSELSGVIAVATGHCHTVALKEDGKIVVWQHGTGDTFNYGQWDAPHELTSGLQD